MRNIILKALCVIVILLVGFITILWIWPIDTSGVRPRIDPMMDYTQSVTAIQMWSQTDADQDIADYCRPIFLTHGKKMDQAVVLYHGYTNCPRQYEELAQVFFERGYNVYVPRLPHHGSRDRLAPDIGQLTLEDLMMTADRSVNIAQGLGDKVTVLGLSLGGVMAAWTAQFRGDVDTAVILVPSFGWYYLPGVVKPILTAAYLLPDALLWWHPLERENRQIPYSMYHKFSTRGMGHTLMLGLSVLQASRHYAPLASHIIIMTTDMDRAVDNWNVQHLMSRWQQQGAKVRYDRFPAELKIEHDIIDPLQPYARPNEVYQKIFEMIDYEETP